MNRKSLRTYGLFSASVLPFALLFAGGCSQEKPETEGVATSRAALDQAADLSFRITGVRAPNGSLLNSFSAIRMTLRTSWDDNQAIGNQILFHCGTALGSTFGGGILCNQGGDAKFHSYPEYTNPNLIGVSTLPDVYVRNESFPPFQSSATVDVHFGLSPGPTGGFGGESLWSSLEGNFRATVDLSTHVIEPAFGSIAGAVCGFRRKDGTSFGICPRTCAATSGPECRQNCVFLSAAGGPWEVCYDIGVCSENEVPDGVDNDCDGDVDECDTPGATEIFDGIDND